MFARRHSASVLIDPTRLARSPCWLTHHTSGAAEMNYLAIVVKLLFKHGADAQKLFQLIPDAKAVIDGPKWVANRLEPTKRIIDVAYPIADEIEETIASVKAMPVEAQRAEEAKLKAKAAAMGIDFAALMQLAQIVWNFIEFIRAQRNVGQIKSLDFGDTIDVKVE